MSIVDACVRESRGLDSAPSCEWRKNQNRWNSTLLSQCQSVRVHNQSIVCKTQVVFCDSWPQVCLIKHLNKRGFLVSLKYGLKISNYELLCSWRKGNSPVYRCLEYVCQNSHVSKVGSSIVEKSYFNLEFYAYNFW